MAKLPAIHLYPGDWLRDQISGCSLAAQGLWLRMMFLMHDSEEYGYLSVGGKPMPFDQAARRCSCSVQDYSDLTKELQDAGVISTTPEGVIFCRRMVRDAKEREKQRTYMEGYRSSKVPCKGSCKPPVRQMLNMLNEDDNDKEVEVSSSLKGGLGENTAEELMAKIRAIGTWKNANAVGAEHALVDVLAGGADPDEVYKALCRIYVWTKEGRMCRQLAEVIPRWQEPQKNWQWEEKGNGKPKGALGVLEQLQEDARQLDGK